MDEVSYALYMKEAKKADELNEIIKAIATEEGWLKGIPDNLVTPSKLHAFAFMKGLITIDERNLLYHFYSR